MYLEGKVLHQIARQRDSSDNVVYKRLASACRKFGYQRKEGEYYNEIRQKVVALFMQYAPEQVNHAEFGYAPPNQLYQSRHGEICVSRPMLENQCYAAMTEPGGLCRIKGAKHTGKTTLQNQVLGRLSKEGYDTVALSFSMASRTIFEELDSFLKWFCAAVSRELNLPNRVNECWDDILSANSSATDYFETYILESRDKPLVLALDDTDRVFEHEMVAIDFCQLLRGWHLRARNNTRMSHLWQNLRLLIIHSTDIYGAIDVNASPISNVGTVLPMEEFTAEQVHELARQRQIPWSVKDAEKLDQLIGRHPALMNVTFDYLEKNYTLEKILRTAHTEESIYTSYLREHLDIFGKTPDLANIFKQIIGSKTPIQVGTNATFQLQSMGLIRVNGNLSSPRNELYREYFRNRL